VIQVTWRRAAGLALLASLVVVNTHVRGDGNGYYAWLASAVVDRDLDFRNQYQHADPLFRNHHIDESGQTQPDLLTPTGHVGNQWAVGPAVLWSPWFLAAHAVVLVTGTDPQDGYAPIYRRFVATGSMVYGFLALVLGVSAARRFRVSAAAIRIAAILMWAGSALLMYAYMLPFHVHTSAAFTTALFLWCWIVRDGRFSRSEWAAWGMCCGLMGMSYHVDLVLGVVALHALKKSWASRRWHLAGDAAAFAAAALVTALPQWIGKSVVYGSPLATGYRDEFLWFAPKLFDTLFSTNHGAILWTPVIGIGVIGWAILRRDARIVWMAVAALLFYFTIASYQNWHGLSSFGNRFFISLTLPLLIGVAAVADRAIRGGRIATLATVIVAAMLILWNAGLAFQWVSKMIPNRGGVNFGLVVSQQFQAPRLMLTYGYRYFTDRDNLIAEIERWDQMEQSRHFNRR
jgi:hypothetical protein